MEALNRTLQNAIFIWRLSDLLSAMVYLVAALTLIEFTSLDLWLIVAIGYLPCTLMLAALERSSHWNPVLVDVRSRAYREV